MRYGVVCDIFHYIDNPWTVTLEGKRILIISPFVESIKKKIGYTSQDIWQTYSNCRLLLKPPQTQGDEDCEEFYVEFNKFCMKF